METWLAFGAGCFVGFFIGITFLALLDMFRRGDDYERLYDQEYVRRNDIDSTSKPLPNYQEQDVEPEKTVPLG
jgi:hypothetical protein